MLNFDEQRYLGIQSGAVSLAGDLKETLDSLLSAGRDTLVFSGAGGVGMLTRPAAELMIREASTRTFWERPAELTTSPPAYLNERSIVIVPSLSGTTKESIELIGVCEKVGATVIALTGHADSPVASSADFNFSNFAEDDTSSESFYIQSLLIALAAMDREGDSGGFGQAVTELELLPAHLVAAKEAFEERAEAWAEAFRDEPYHIISGAGPLWPEAWYYGTCILEEMQWIRTRPIHAADFFHGTLELLEPDVSLILIKGGGSRALSQRVERFAGTVTDKMSVLDVDEFELPGISERLRDLVAPVVAAAVLQRLSAHLEVKRDHPLTTRRYYRRSDY